MSAAMPWFKLYRDIASAPKLFELEAIVGPAALAHLSKMWCGVAAHRSSGDLTGLADAVVERWADWRGPPGELMAAFRTVGFIDGTVVRGWAERQDSLVAKFEADAARPNAKERHPERGPDKTPIGAPIVRGEERREEKRRGEKEDPDARANEKSVPAPVNPDRPEPLGAYGEVFPKSAEGILAYVHQGKTLRERWEGEHPELGVSGVLRGLEAAMAHRQSLEGPRLRQWFWSAGFISKVDTWLGRDRHEAVKLAKDRGFAAKAGVHLPVGSAAPPTAERLWGCCVKLAMARGAPVPPPLIAGEAWATWQRANSGLVQDAARRAASVGTTPATARSDVEQARREHAPALPDEVLTPEEERERDEAKAMFSRLTSGFGAAGKVAKAPRQVAIEARQALVKARGGS